MLLRQHPCSRSLPAPYPNRFRLYDLRLSETREEQAKLAAEYGIEGFCYYLFEMENAIGASV